MKAKLPTILTGLVVLSGLAMLYLAYLYTMPFTPNPPITVTNNPAPVRPDLINPEAVVIVSPEICKKIAARAQVSRVLVSDTTQILLNDYTNYLPKGCSTPKLTAIIPSNTPDGKYHIEYTVVYQLSQFKNTTVYWRTQEFTVKHEPPLPVVMQTQVTPSSQTNQTGQTSNQTSSQTTTTNNTTTNAPVTNNAPKENTVQRLLHIIGL